MNEISNLVSRWHIGRIHPTPDVEPEGWTLERLCDIARLESGHTPSRNRPDYWDGDIPWLSLHDSKKIEGKSLYKTKMTVSALGLANSSARLLPPGTVALSRTATIGKVAVLGREMATSQDFACYICGPRLLNSYLAHLFRGMEVEWDRLMAGSTHNTIYMPTFENIQILVPPMAEQEAIAEALSDADALIEGLERLIAKKRLIKQGAMQDLLTAKRRLPGFSGEWTPCKLGERGQFFKGSGVRKHEANSGFLPCVRYGELYTLHHDVVRSFASFISTEVAKTARPIKSGDILFAGSGETKEEIGKCAVVTLDGDMYAGGDIIAFRPTADDPVFLSYLLNAPLVQKQKARKGQGDAVVHISATGLGDLDLLLPSEDEQSKISAVLEDMDAEIQALETRLEKTRAIKEGMMQNLLTGRIRLV